MDDINKSIKFLLSNLINRYSIDKLEKILVGNKTDMSEKRKVSSREG
jgi:hypothetical protein